MLMNAEQSNQVVVDRTRVATEIAQHREELRRAQVLREASYLRHVADPRAIARVPNRVDRLTVDGNSAGVGTRETEDGLDERRFSGAVGSDDARDAPWRDGDVDVPKYGARTEALEETANLDHGSLRGLIAGLASASISGVSAGSTRSAASSSDTKALRSRMSDG